MPTVHCLLSVVWCLLSDARLLPHMCSLTYSFFSWWASNKQSTERDSFESHYDVFAIPGLPGTSAELRWYIDQHRNHYCVTSKPLLFDTTILCNTKITNWLPGMSQTCADTYYSAKTVTL
jgi:hypothetical protein